MTSRFNTLLHGEPGDVADALDNSPNAGRTDAADELRLALINALRRIDAIEKRQALAFEQIGETLAKIDVLVARLDCRIAKEVIVDPDNLSGVVEPLAPTKRCPECRTWGHTHRRDCRYAGTGTANHVPVKYDRR